jgi:tuftelin-interacting protein 11
MEDSSDNYSSSDNDTKKHQPRTRKFGSDGSQSEDERPSFIKTKPVSFVKHEVAPTFVSATKRPVKKTAKGPKLEFGQFEQFTKGIGLKLLMKSGFKPGQGLGKEGEGIANPIDVKLRPKGKGIGFGGFDERTDAVKLEQVFTNFIQGIPLLDPDEPLIPKREGWKKSKVKRRKVFMTSKELIQNIGIVKPTKSVKIRDLTGKDERIVSEGQSLNQYGKLAELLHNVNLLAEMSHEDLLQIARKSKLEQLNLEINIEAHDALKMYIKTDTVKLINYQRILEICKECKELSQTTLKPITNFSEVIDELFGEGLDELLRDYYKEFVELKLDSFIIAIFQTIFKIHVKSWDPLTNCFFAVQVFKDYRLLLITNSDKMSSYELMLYNIWLPKIRHTIKYIFY